MLYNGQLVIVGTFLRNGPNQGQTFTENLYIADIFIADICYRLLRLLATSLINNS